MSVIRVHKTKDFTVMSNAHLRDKELSLKAKGLLSVMLTLPDDWDYSIAGLVAICKENETAVKSALNELKANNYVIVKREEPTKENGGRIKYNYEVYEQPQQTKTDKQPIEKQGVENLGVEFQGVENVGQLNTNKSITNKSNTKGLNTYAFSESKDSSKGDIYAFSDEKGEGEPIEENFDVADIAKSFVGSLATEDRISNLKQIIAYFLNLYNKTQNTRHIRITEQALTKIVINYFESNGTFMEDVYDFESYKLLIDLYLSTNYKNTTKSLQHFMSGKIRENLANKCLR